MEFLFKNLIVWQNAMELAKLVYGLVRQLPAEERYCPPPPLFSPSLTP